MWHVGPALRRMSGAKRKRETTPTKMKKQKKRKLDKLVGWGEQTSQLKATDLPPILQEEELGAALRKETEQVKKQNIEKLKQTKLIEYNKDTNSIEESCQTMMKGKTLSKKMTKKELKLVKETSMNIFDWLKPNKKKEVITEDDTEKPMEVVDREKEERLWGM